jgi:choline monooxygenase
MLKDDQALAQAALDHIAAGSTDTGTGSWREPVQHYLSRERFDEELRALRTLPTVLCPSAALAVPGAHVARAALGVSLLAVRDLDGHVRVFRNACRHRGMEVGRGTGCAKALVCPYHGWTYGLDGGLRHVPHAEGFPDVDRSDRGLVEIGAVEAHGLVFVSPDGPATLPPEIHEIDGLVAPPDHTFVGVDEQTEPANWKILTETFLEGLHIRFLHRATFFPVQYDNTNVVEHFGPHSRVTFPYRAVTRLADRPPAERRIDGKLTLVYHLFPNAVVATFPGLRLLFVLDPVAPAETRLVTFAFSTSAGGAAPPSGGEPRGERPLLLDGVDEDFDAARSVQRGLARGANEFLEFGLYESAIGHFHRHLDRAIEATA